ncbi:MAG: hypothetical protein QY311_03280 [Candidatus Paceibacterota bacterium]|nr:MAG: hypothetical protein QY311_03280 [Candidatus Paceibacterota bacterium]
MTIIPAILAHNPEEFQQLWEKVAGHTQRIHIDIADGTFVPTRTVAGIQEIACIPDDVFLDVHLMVSSVSDALATWLATRADRIIMHAESTDMSSALIARVVESGKRAWIALNPDTDPAAHSELFLRAQGVQFMTVQPGAYGAPFLPQVIERMAVFHEEHTHVPLMVDGGITPETARMVERVGCEEAVCGSYIMRSADPLKALSDFS